MYYGPQNNHYEPTNRNCNLVDPFVLIHENLDFKIKSPAEVYKMIKFGLLEQTL